MTSYKDYMDMAKSYEENHKYFQRLADKYKRNSVLHSQYSALAKEKHQKAIECRAQAERMKTH